MGGQSWWPCNANGLCQCADGPVPVTTTTVTTTKVPATTSGISSTTPVQTSTAFPAKSCKACNGCTSIPGNSHGATDEQCMSCAMGGQSWWPCNANGLCQCADGPVPVTTTTVTTTKMPATTSAISSTTPVQTSTSSPATGCKTCTS